MCVRSEKTTISDRTYVQEGERVEVYTQTASGRVFLFSFKCPTVDTATQVMADLNDNLANSLI